MKARPAETAGAAGVVGLLIAYIFGVTDSQTIVTVAAGVGLVPAAVTGLIQHGGVVGLAKKLWRGSVKGGS